MTNADQAERWIADWESGVRLSAERSKAVAAALADIRVSARSEDGLVEVTVGTPGAVLDLKLDERIRSQPADRTAQQVMATIGAAFADLTARVSKAMSAGTASGGSDAAG